jgi:hypothetical protein
MIFKVRRRIPKWKVLDPVSAADQAQSRELLGAG